MAYTTQPDIESCVTVIDPSEPTDFVHNVEHLIPEDILTDFLEADSEEQEYLIHGIISHLSRIAPCKLTFCEHPKKRGVWGFWDVDYELAYREPLSADNKITIAMVVIVIIGSIYFRYIHVF